VPFTTVLLVLLVLAAVGGTAYVYRAQIMSAYQAYLRRREAQVGLLKDQLQKSCVRWTAGACCRNGYSFDTSHPSVAYLSSDSALWNHLVLQTLFQTVCKPFFAQNYACHGLCVVHIGEPIPVSLAHPCACRAGRP
jgi:hypothetical protein